MNYRSDSTTFTNSFGTGSRTLWTAGAYPARGSYWRAQAWGSSTGVGSRELATQYFYFS